MTVRDHGPAILVRGSLFAFLWWALADGAAGAWPIGVPAILLALLVSIAILPPARLRWWGFVQFAPFFLRRSLTGAADVAWRAVHPRLPVAPAMIEYPLRLPPGLQRVCMANTVSLLPGTLSVALHGDTLRIHVLDDRPGIRAELERVEFRVARIFGTSPQLPDGND